MPPKGWKSTKPHPSKLNISEEEYGKALRATGGLICHAAALLKISHTSFSRAIERYPALLEVIKQCREKRVDDAEAALWTLVRERNLGAVCFTLKTIGKNRGYVEELDADQKAIKLASQRLTEIQKLLFSPLPDPLETVRVESIEEGKDGEDSRSESKE